MAPIPTATFGMYLNCSVANGERPPVDKRERPALLGHAATDRIASFYPDRRKGESLASKASMFPVEVADAHIAA